MRRVFGGFYRRVELSRVESSRVKSSRVARHHGRKYRWFSGRRKFSFVRKEESGNTKLDSFDESNRWKVSRCGFFFFPCTWFANRTKMIRVARPKLVNCDHSDVTVTVDRSVIFLTHSFDKTQTNNRPGGALIANKWFLRIEGQIPGREYSSIIIFFHNSGRSTYSDPSLFTTKSAPVNSRLIGQRNRIYTMLT